MTELPPYRRSLLVKLAVPAWLMFLLGAGLRTLGIQHNDLLPVHLGVGLIVAAVPLAIIGAMGFFVLVFSGRDPRMPDVYRYSLLGGFSGVLLMVLMSWGLAWVVELSL